jgi:undecaprenyl-diphosphatase
VGLLIIYAGIRSDKSRRGGAEIQLPESLWIGVVQGFCLPFRGFSRSGSTISAGLILGLSRRKLEEFSFALAVVLTPPVIAREGLRLLKANKEGAHIPMLHLLAPSLVGMVFSFAAGLVALKWLSQWLEGGRWKLFGFYCVAASVGVLTLHFTMGL